MNWYGLALFLHLLALLGAVAGSTLVHLSLGKLRGARSCGEGLQWLGLAHAVSPVFPVALAVLVGTGAWMVHGRWPWSAGFVVAGLTGVVYLAVAGGAVEGGRARKLAAALASSPSAPLDQALVRDPVLWCVSWANTGVALAVVLAMVEKSSLAVSFAMLGVGLASGCAVGLAFRARVGRPRLATGS